MRTAFSRLIVLCFFLLFTLGCASNISPSYKIGDRVKVKCNDKEQIGVMTESWYNSLSNYYRYRVYCNGDYSWYNDENLEIVDPMPSTLRESEEASWNNENKKKQKTLKIETSQNLPKDS